MSLNLDDCLACQAVWNDQDPQHAHVCLACPGCGFRPLGYAIGWGPFCPVCNWTGF